MVNFREHISMFIFKNRISLCILFLQYLFVLFFQGAIPTFISPDPGGSVLEVPETQFPSTHIYTVEAQDADGGNITYGLIATAPAAPLFELEDTSLRHNGQMDYETMPTSYLLTFR